VWRRLLHAGEVELIIAADHATFFDPHTTYGMTAVFESMHMLQKMPLHEIMRLALLGANERLSAERAHQISGWCPRSCRSRTFHDAAAGSRTRSPRRRRSRSRAPCAPSGAAQDLAAGGEGLDFGKVLIWPPEVIRHRCSKARNSSPKVNESSRASDERRDQRFGAHSEPDAICGAIEPMGARSSKGSFPLTSSTGQR